MQSKIIVLIKSIFLPNFELTINTFLFARDNSTFIDLKKSKSLFIIPYNCLHSAKMNKYSNAGIKQFSDSGVGFLLDA